MSRLLMLQAMAAAMACTEGLNVVDEEEQARRDALKEAREKAATLSAVQSLEPSDGYADPVLAELCEARRVEARAWTEIRSTPTVPIRRREFFEPRGERGTVNAKAKRRKRKAQKRARRANR